MSVRESVHYEVLVADGTLVEREVVDGAAPSEGLRATYDVVEDGTLLLHDDCGDATLGWVAADEDRALRVLSPVAVYRPGETETSEPPADLRRTWWR